MYDVVPLLHGNVSGSDVISRWFVGGHGIGIGSSIGIDFVLIFDYIFSPSSSSSVSCSSKWFVVSLNDDSTNGRVTFYQAVLFVNGLV